MLFTILLLTTSSIAVTLLAARTIVTLKRHSYTKVIYDGDLPTVSVCIAARNETHALAECLERVLKNDYEKLEILVLDDSSDDDTSLIIKSFAHAGVRFIAGTPLPDGWLGKNHAYQTLVQESSGDVLLFIDVDTAIEPTAISQLVAHLLGHKKAMLSVLPRREDATRPSAVFGTLRYYWELLLGTRKCPPAASALWLVEKSRLQEDGIGLSNYGLSVRPERHLARQLQHQDLYEHIIGTKELGVSFEKRLKSQYETALRLYYPASGRKIVHWIGASLFLLLLIVPVFAVFWTFDNLALFCWNLLLVIVLAMTFGLFTLRTYGGGLRIIRVILGPFLTVQELVLLLLSYSKYRFGTVTWKGRQVNAQPTRADAIHLSE